MQSYSSKSQKRSQSKSKNGGRRKKRTLKNVRRRKSRKVMRGGHMVTYEELEQTLDKMNAKNAFLRAMGRNDNDFDAFKTETMTKTENANEVELNSILDVISNKPLYANAVKAITQLNESKLNESS